MQIFRMCYNLKFRKLTFYGLTRPQSIRKSRQMSGQTILSSPQVLEFNPNFAKNRDIQVVKNNSQTNGLEQNKMAVSSCVEQIGGWGESE